MDAQFYVYCWTNLVNGKRYVGKGKGKRGRAHVRPGALRKAKSLIARAIAAHGASSFSYTKLHTGLTEAQALSLEVAWIALLGSKSPGGYNLSLGGEGGATGVKRSSEWIERHRARMRGKPCAPETRAAISAAQKGRKGKPCSEKQKEKMRNRAFSAEHRARISEAKRGWKKTDAQCMAGRSLRGAQASNARILFALGATRPSIGRWFGVSRQAVSTALGPQLPPGRNYRGHVPALDSLQRKHVITLAAKLIPETRIAVMLGVSRTTVRRALAESKRTGS